MYELDIEVRQVTKTKKDIRYCARTDEDNHDLTTEAQPGLVLSQEDHVRLCKTM